MFNARDISGRVAEKRVWGDRQHLVPGHRRASRVNRHPQMRLTPGYPESTHCQECLIHQLSMQHEPKAPDSHRSNSPERATRRLTSPSVHACPTLHCGKTLRRPAPHASTRTLPSRAHSDARGTRPTDASHPRRQAPPPRTHVVAPTPAAHPRRTCAPRMRARPEHTRPHVYPVGPRKQGFQHMSAVRETGLSAYAVLSA